MLWEKGYEFKKNMRKIENNNQVVIGNRNSGQWIKITKQCYDILNMGIENGLSVNQLIGKLADEDDKEYFTKLIRKIEKVDVLKNKGVKEQFQKKEIDFAVTNRCNLKCIHCCVDAGVVGDKEVLSTDEVKQIIDKIVDYNPKSINFTGGEPLLREDFIDILKYASEKYSGKISILTNATLINEGNVKILTEILSNIDISIDGVDEESCAPIRGKGVFNRVIDSVKLLQKNNFDKISLSMVILNENKHLRDEFDRLNKKLGTRGIIRQFSPIGRGEVNKHISIEEPDKTTKKQTLSKKQLKEIADGLKICHCGAGCKELYINYQGFIYPCGLFEKEEYKLCHVNDIEDFKSYFEGEDYIKSKGYKSLMQIQPDIFEKCKDCNINLFCWNCLHYLDLIKDGKIGHDCNLAQKQVGKVVWGI